MRKMSNDEKIEEKIESSENKENQEETINAESINNDETKLDDETFFKSDNIEAKSEKTSNGNKIIIIIGYIFALLIPLIGFIYGIILAIVNKPPSYREHGIYIILVSVIMWVIYFLLNIAVIP